MANTFTFNFNNIVKGQQLKLFLDDNKTLIFKTENNSQGTRFAVFGETLAGEKVLIPAFTEKELDIKYDPRVNYQAAQQRTNNCTNWKSKTWFGIKTPRFLDVEEIYLLNTEGSLRKYDGSFFSKVCFQRSDFYVSNEATYNFEDLNFFFLKEKVSKILLENNVARLPMTENVSLIAQATERIGVSSTFGTTKLLTMPGKINLFIEAIKQLPEAIELFVYYQELEDKAILEINDVISQDELLHKLNITTGCNFSKEELVKFKTQLKVIETNKETGISTVKLNLEYKVNDNKGSRNFISSEFQIKSKFKSKVSLLFNLFSGGFLMFSMNKYATLMSAQDKKKVAIFFPKLDSVINEIDNKIKKNIGLIDEYDSIVHALPQAHQQWKENIDNWKNRKELSEIERAIGIEKDKENLDNMIKKNKKLLIENENNKQIIFNDLVINMKLVNNLQMLSYLQKSLFIKSKQYLIASNVFYQVHNLFSRFSFSTIEKYVDYYVNSKNEGNNFHAIDCFVELDNLLNNNFSEFVEIYKLLPIEFQNKGVYNITKLLFFLDEFKKIEFNKLLRKNNTINNEEHMAKVYLSLLKFSKYEGLFSSFVSENNDLEMELSKSVKNSEEFKRYEQRLKDLRVIFWKSYDFTTLINELINIYFPNEKQQILVNFALEEHFLLEKQILQSDVVNNNYKNKTEEKFTNVMKKLKINQQLAQGFQEELFDAFQISKQRVEKKLNEERIKAGKWEVNDIIIVNSILNINGINENQTVSFKVLTKNKNDFTVIFQYLNSKKQLEYKIRDITIDNCRTFNFALTKEEITFPNQQEILELQLLINDYITWKDKTIPECVKLLLEKLNKINNPILNFVKVKNQNSFNDWEWEINLQKIKEKLLKIIDEEIRQYDKLKVVLDEKLKATEDEELKLENLKKIIIDDILKFDFTENCKEKIKNLNENVNELGVIFDIIYDSKFLGNYKTQASTINFRILRDSSIAKNRLASIKKEIEKITTAVWNVNDEMKTTIKNLNDLQNSIINFLQTKKEEWETLSNHTNLKVQWQNQQILAQLKSDIKQLVEKVTFINNKISESCNKKVENSLFYREYLTFIEYYQKASEVTFSEIEKYLYWDKNYQIIKNNLKIDTGYDNFDQYKTEFLSNIQTIDIEHCKKTLGEISKIKFKKLSWWQKIINKISWTWTKTKIAIRTLKADNKKDFENLIKVNSNVSLTNTINISSQEENNQSILPTSEPWDQWIIEKKPKCKNDIRLSCQSSNDSAISLFSAESEEDDYSNDNIDKILREFDSNNLIYDSDLENSNELSYQEFNHPINRISRTHSSDSGICSGQSTPPKPVSTNSLDECNSLVYTEPLPSKLTLKL